MSSSLHLWTYAFLSASSLALDSEKDLFLSSIYASNSFWRLSLSSFNTERVDSTAFRFSSIFSWISERIWSRSRIRSLMDLSVSTLSSPRTFLISSKALSRESLRSVILSSTAFSLSASFSWNVTMDADTSSSISLRRASRVSPVLLMASSRSSMVSEEVFFTLSMASFLFLLILSNVSSKWVLRAVESSSIFSLEEEVNSSILPFISSVFSVIDEIMESFTLSISAMAVSNLLSRTLDLSSNSEKISFRLCSSIETESEAFFKSSENRLWASSTFSSISWTLSSSLAKEASALSSCSLHISS